MARGICLAIGLNDFDRSSPAYLGVQAEPLRGCVNDANSIAALIQDVGGAFDPPTVLTSPPGPNDILPTATNVLARIGEAAQTLKAGDLFVLHYSGHGMQGTVDQSGTTNPDSDQGSSWILYDRPLSSDELFRSWAPFAPGVRILVLSDSCFSGSAIKAGPIPTGPQVYHAPRLMGRTDRAQILRNLAAHFPGTVIGKSITKKPAEGDVPNATLLLLSGCQSDQESLDAQTGSTFGGLFTTTVVSVFGANGGFSGDYNAFYEQVRQETLSASLEIDSTSPQEPNFFPLGNADDLVIFAGSSPPFSL